MHKKKILILGAGIGGMEVYKALHKKLCTRNSCMVDLTVINADNYYTFVPMLHEAATGGVEINHVVTPVREIMDCHNHSFLKSKIEFIDIKNKLVKTTDSGNINFDIAVIATGSKSSFFGIPGAQTYSLQIRTAKDAQVLRDRLNEIFENVASGKLRGQINIIIVGGGAVGVELAGQTQELLKDISKLYPKVIKHMFKIILVHGGDRLLPASHPRLSTWALRELEKRGVEVMLNSIVAEVGENKIKLKNGKEIESSIKLWCAGLEPCTKNLLDKEFLDEKGFVAVDSTMSISNHPHIFAVGDNARIYTLGQPTGPYMLAEAAYDGAKVVAKNIIKLLNGVHEYNLFRFKSKGTLIPIGDNFAIAELFGFFRFKGLLAWWLRRSVYLIYIYSWRDKARVLFEWFMDIFGTRDTTRL